MVGNHHKINGNVIQLVVTIQSVARRWTANNHKTLSLSGCNTIDLQAAFGICFDELVIASESIREYLIKSANGKLDYKESKIAQDQLSTFDILAQPGGSLVPRPFHVQVICIKLVELHMQKHTLIQLHPFS